MDETTQAWLDEIGPTIIRAHGASAPLYLRQALLVVDCITAGKTLASMPKELALEHVERTFMSLIIRSLALADQLSGEPLEDRIGFTKFLKQTLERRLTHIMRMAKRGKPMT